MSEKRGGRLRTRREVVRRHRRERQVVVFGLLLIVVAAISVGAAAVYRGEATGPFDSTFVTSLEDYQSTITLVCPPSNTLPLEPEDVAVRVLNGTDTNGLAGALSSELEDRGFTMVGATNWSRTYTDTIRILFGPNGITQAYTVARHFTEVEMVLDNREGTAIDIIIGEEYDASTALVSTYDSSLSQSTALYTDEDCLPWTQIEQNPAPATLPDNPLATVTATPSPSASGDEESDDE